MRRITALLLVAALLLSGCGKASQPTPSSDSEKQTESMKEPAKESQKETEPSTAHASSEAPSAEQAKPKVDSLDDPELRDYLLSTTAEEVEDKIENCEVSDVQVQYLTKTYLKHLNYNSQETLFFGYSLSELDSRFQSAPYLFTIEDGETVVVEDESRKGIPTLSEMLVSSMGDYGGLLVTITATITDPSTLATQTIEMVFELSPEQAEDVYDGVVGLIEDVPSLASSVLAVSSGNVTQFPNMLIYGYQTVQDVMQIYSAVSEN